MANRIIKNTNIYLTRSDGVTLAFGEGKRFEIYGVKGLGIGEIEKETTGSALSDGELWLGSRITNRVLEITTRWNTAANRRTFTDFFQHNMRFEARVEFNGDNYYGSCVLNSAYELEAHEGRLFSGSEIELELYFDDPYLYTETIYKYQIAAAGLPYFNFYTNPANHVYAVPPGEGYIHIFSLLTEVAEYTITNPSSTSNGITARIKASGNVRNPILRNITTGMQFKLGLSYDPLIMTSGDELVINTQLRFVSAELTRTNTSQPVDVLLRYLTQDSRMVQVQPGLNKLMFDADQGANMASCEISFRGKVLAI